MTNRDAIYVAWRVAWPGLLGELLQFVAHQVADHG